MKKFVAHTAYYNKDASVQTAQVNPSNTKNENLANIVELLTKLDISKFLSPASQRQPITPIAQSIQTKSYQNTAKILQQNRENTKSLQNKLNFFWLKVHSTIQKTFCA